MSLELIGAVSVFVVIGLILLLRLPVWAALGLVGLVGYGVTAGWPPALNRLGNTPFELAEAYSLSVVPLFLWMGAVASRSGMSNDIFRAANALFAGRRGALAMATVGACAAFSAICGSSLATAATMSRVAIPEMRKFGYDERLSVGVVASGGVLGILIPPSVILVIYAVLAQESVSALYAAAVVPGVLLTILHLAVVRIVCRINPDMAPLSAPMEFRERLRDILKFSETFLLFSVAIGGIFVGLFSATEGAAVACFGVIVLGLLRGRINLAVLWESLNETVRTTAMLFFIVLAALLYSYFLVQTGLAEWLVDVVVRNEVAPILVVLSVVVFYLLLGCVMDSLGMILVTVPVFLPLLVSVGFDALWFGIFVVLLVEVSLITPPVGMNLFVIQAQQPSVGVGTLYRGVVPFLFAHATAIILLIAWPAVALWFPRLLGL